ncbi:hypothetical protein Scep_004877 [Stephania cephalantha]|uniref:Uncharacterized protein n=1 Tax=Stephania cephalantha TaxID=152367 RepID=A0AAP0PVT8_9MAGN
MGNWDRHSWYQSLGSGEPRGKFNGRNKTQNQRKLGTVELIVEPYDPDLSLRLEVKRVEDI